MQALQTLHLVSAVCSAVYTLHGMNYNRFFIDHKEEEEEMESLPLLLSPYLVSAVSVCTPCDVIIMFFVDHKEERVEKRESLSNLIKLKLHVCSAMESV